MILLYGTKKSYVVNQLIFWEPCSRVSSAYLKGEAETSDHLIE